MKLCKQCNQKITIGRKAKIFCKVACKSKYPSNLISKTKSVSIKIDAILHRNRSILFEIMGNHKKQIKIKRLVLEKKKFRFNYHTHFYGCLSTFF